MTTDPIGVEKKSLHDEIGHKYQYACKSDNTDAYDLS